MRGYLILIQTSCSYEIIILIQVIRSKFIYLKGCKCIPGVRKLLRKPRSIPEKLPNLPIQIEKRVIYQIVYILKDDSIGRYIIFQRIGKLIRNISVPLPAEKTHKFLSFDILIDFGWRERSNGLCSRWYTWSENALETL